MIKILKNLRKIDIVLILAVVIFTCLQVYLDLSLPDYMSDITMLVQTEGSDMSDIYSAGFSMVFCALGSLGLAVIVAVIASKIASNFSFVTRSKVFNKVMGYSNKEINEFSTSSLITRTTNDITQVQLLIVMGMQMLIKAPITAVWALIKISDGSSSWTIVTGIALVILLIIVSTCLILVVPKFKKLQILTDNINKVSKESLDGLNVVRAYNAFDYQGEKFEAANKELTKSNVFTSTTLSFLMPSIQMVSSGLVLAVYIVGAVLVNEAIGMDKMTIFSDMVVFSSYAMQVIISFMMLVMVFMLFPRASVSAKRINEVLSSNSIIVEGNETKGKKNLKGEVEFVNVSFKYPDAEDYVLKNINFKASQGDVIAFIGSTGCGKSTIVNLVPRFYDVSEGEVLVNGKNVKSYTKKSLNNLIGYVSQKATLFTGTITSNVAFGDNKVIKDDNSGLISSLDIAQASDFIENLEDKHEAYVAQGGKNFSGGQKQRVSIARAIMRNPEIFIFDDSFSALDYKTDSKLRKTLSDECGNATMLIVGQRIGTIKNADKIIVLEDGEIVGMGKHKELLKSCDTYKQIALSQLSEEELNNE